MTTADKPTSRRTESMLDEVFALFSERARQITMNPYRSRYSLLLETLTPYLRGRGSLEILDVGAGAGVIPLVLTRMGHSVVATDTWREYEEGCDEPMGTKEAIIARLESNGIPTKYCDIEIEALHFEDRSFDVVTFLAVIEHLHTSPRNPLQEIRRVLRPDGVLLLETVNLATLRNRVLALLGRSNYTEVSVWFNSEPFFSHVREYTPREIKSMLQWTGFRVDQIVLSNCLHTTLIKELKRSPVKLTALLFYIAVTSLVPALRYELIEVARKAEGP